MVSTTAARNVLITGSAGFVGRNLLSVLRTRQDLQIHTFDLGQNIQELHAALQQCDVIFHLAGINRTQHENEFHEGNTVFTQTICDYLISKGRNPKIVFSSSIQAELDNPYGKSKREAEEILKRYSETTGAECAVYRFKNLFGKWCRPNYNAVTATFCHNIAHDLPVQISDPNKVMELTYIDDVLDAFIGEMTPKGAGFRFAPELSNHRITLGGLAEKIAKFKNLRTQLILPDFSEPFERALYATYLSYLDQDHFDYTLDIKTDQRGSLAEFLKSSSAGQIFISRTKPGIVRGNHYHHTKTEKFLVMQGQAQICFRHIEKDEVITYHVRGEDHRVLDIPPGYTHCIENTGDTELVTLFWSSEVFNADKTDTTFMEVDVPTKKQDFGKCTN